MFKLFAILLFTGLSLFPSSFFSQNYQSGGPYPTIVQTAFQDDGGGSTGTLSFTNPTTAGNAIVVVMAGSSDTIGAPSATGVTFTRCVPCEAFSNGSLSGDIYYAFSTVSVSAINYTAPGAAAILSIGIYEVHGATAFVTGAESSNDYEPYTGATAALTLTSPNTLLIAVQSGVSGATYSGVESGWISDASGLTFGNFFHGTQSSAGSAAFTVAFPSGFAAPTISVAAFR